MVLLIFVNLAVLVEVTKRSGPLCHVLALEVVKERTAKLALREQTLSQSVFSLQFQMQPASQSE